MSIYKRSVWVVLPTFVLPLLSACSASSDGVSVPPSQNVTHTSSPEMGPSSVDELRRIILSGSDITTSQSKALEHFLSSPFPTKEERSAFFGVATDLENLRGERNLTRDPYLRYRDLWELVSSLLQRSERSAAHDSKRSRELLSLALQAADVPDRPGFQPPKQIADGRIINGRYMPAYRDVEPTDWLRIHDVNNVTLSDLEKSLQKLSRSGLYDQSHIEEAIATIKAVRRKQSSFSSRYKNALGQDERKLADIVSKEQSVVHQALAEIANTLQLPMRD